MFFFLVVGITEKVRKENGVGGTVRFCPQCGRETLFQPGRLGRYFVLFMVPILRMGKERPVLVCSECGLVIDLLGPPG